ncbi:MAG: RnfABCDGE type electron transport complex subunit B, partial [Arenicellales bacterium]
MPASLAEIDACLPQTQCTRCSYPCCEDYAKALITGEANINQCPPGGEVTIEKLATLLNQAVLPLDHSFGEFQPKTLAFIIENKCIGCVLCIKACPVEAIMGANKKMHTIIQANCTGCELCLPVCPTDCIEMLPLSHEIQNSSDWPDYSQADINTARTRFTRQAARLARKQAAKQSATLDKQSRQ